MKKALPANAKISKDAKETIQECISEFISFITGNDLLWAMTTLGFEEYVKPLKVYLLRFRDMEGKICCVLFGTGTGILVINDEFASLETDMLDTHDDFISSNESEIKEWDFPEEELESNDLGSRNLS
ncbi:nuclear transcription factor Y subunit B-3-like [Camellia sinensis]|uniref:nuclear transcription factor Y subunit B-3-like n=1 Tax=Camellia sinensis TaxID=4442 RepID=UPI00103551AB|nr:nuclear transcription factor Y subunit B-3-like [Camellia sinensis]